jgi:hypothetical protein
MRAACAHLLTAATLDKFWLSPSAQRSQIRDFRVWADPLTALSCVGSRVVCTHTHTRTHARHQYPSPSRQPSAPGQGASPHGASILPTSAPGLHGPIPTHICTGTRSFRPCTSALGLPAAASLRLCPCHICTGTAHTFLSAFKLSCTAVHLSAVHMAGFRPTGPLDVACSRSISPCSGALCMRRRQMTGDHWALSRVP